MACTFQATIGGKFAPLTGLSNEDMLRVEQKNTGKQTGGFRRQ